MAIGKKKDGSVLVVDDNKAILSALKLLLERHFESVRMISNPNMLDSSFDGGRPDVVLLDMNFTASINSGNEGLFWLDRIKQYSPDTEVVLFTAYGDIELAVNGIKKGAFDFVVKPWDNEKLITTLGNACKLSRSRKDVKKLKKINNERICESDMFWGESDTMRRLRETVDKVAGTDANVLITGENGTGKEMLAREIHRLSRRRDEIMMSVDLGALPETLFESEMFGHVKGAFTDAKADRAGKFEVADGGTLFLDEIGNVPYHLQSKLLTAIQNKSIQRVGGNAVINVDVRLISATNRDFPEMIAGNLFREDLFYRINTIHLELPPLRDRREDIIPLARMFLRKYSAKYGRQIEGLDAQAEKELVNYPWHGNIRELKHVMEKVVIMSSGQKIVESGALHLQPAKRVQPSGVFSTLEEMEREMIQHSIDKYNGNLTAVARQLGITRQTLYNKIKRYGL